MREAEIRKYAKLMAELGLTALEISEGENTVRLERGVSAPAAVPSQVIVTETAQESGGENMHSAHSPEHSGLVTVTSPMVGVFYQAPAENAEPYVKVGDHVTQGTVLCLIEAMKMMNEITSDADGIIEEVCVQNGQVVDFGRPLFRIQRSAQ